MIDDILYKCAPDLTDVEHIKLKREILKLIGNCTSCFGKGYATTETFATAKGKKWRTSGPMRFCECERGRQLKKYVTDARIEENSAHLAEIRKNFGQDVILTIPFIARIKELQNE